MSNSTQHLVVQQTTCTLDCPDACGLSVTTEDGRVTKVDAAEDGFTDGFICGKVRQFARHMYCAERIETPLERIGKKGAGQFRAITWPDALTRITDRLRHDRDTYGGESILPLCYGGSNGKLTQDAVDMRFFYRLGASQLDRTVCAAPSSAAYGAIYGKMPGVALTDYVHSRLVIVWGNNPHASGIHLVPAIQEAQRRGAKLVVVDPRRTKLASAADLHLPIYPGTDLPVALAIINWFFEHNRVDEEFLAANANGVEQLRERSSAWSIDDACRVARITTDALQQLIEWYDAITPAVIRCGWGPERNRNGGSAIGAILSLPAIANKFGVRGGGFTMSNSGAWKLNSSKAIQASPPDTRHINMNVLGDALLRLAEPPIKSLFVYNCNPVAILPEQNKVLAGLQREDLFTVVFDQVMTDTANWADIVLPATSFLEHDDLRNGYGNMRMGATTPAARRFGEARPNYEVFSELIQRMQLQQPGDVDQPDALVRALVGPAAAEQLTKVGHLDPAQGLDPVLMVDVHPQTASGKIELFPDSLDGASHHGLYQYIPDCAREHALSMISPSNSKTVNSTFGQFTSAASLAMHPTDADRIGIQEGDAVKAWNDSGCVVVRSTIDPRLRPGVVELSKGIWQKSTINGQTSNALAPDTLSDIGAGHASTIHG